MIKQIFYIAKLNFYLEWKQQQNYLALLVYVISTAYLTYLVFNGLISAQIWNAFFWVIFIFASVQAAHRSLSQEGEKRFLLYLGMVKPGVLILGKILYNFLYLFLVGIMVFLVFLLFMGNKVNNPEVFILLIFLAALDFAAILTFVAGIASKAGNNPALPAILSIPLLYPQILVLSAVSLRALTGFSWVINANYLLVLPMLALVSALLAYVLFPYLWRD